MSKKIIFSIWSGGGGFFFFGLENEIEKKIIEEKQNKTKQMKHVNDFGHFRVKKWTMRNEREWFQDLMKDCTHCVWRQINNFCLNYRVNSNIVIRRKGFWNSMSCVSQKVSRGSHTWRNPEIVWKHWSQTKVRTGTFLGGIHHCPLSCVLSVYVGSEYFYFWINYYKVSQCWIIGSKLTNKYC